MFGTGNALFCHWFVFPYLLAPAEEYVPTRHFASTVEAVRVLQAEGAAVWACETTADAKLYSEAEYPENVALVLGNEVIGVWFEHDGTIVRIV